MNHRLYLMIALATIGGAACSGEPESGPSSGDAITTQDAQNLQSLQSTPELLPGVIVLPREIPVFGKSITRWTEDWYRWISTVPAPRNPDIVLDVACGVDQDQPVFFVPAYIGSRSYVRTCDIPFGRPVLFPVQPVLDSFPCPDPNFKPAPGQTMEDFLRQDAMAYNDSSYRDRVVTLDGRTIDVSRHRHTTRLFTNTVDPSLLPLIPDPCLTGTPQPAVADGWWLMLLLAPGQHDVHVTAIGAVTGQPIDHDYQLRVLFDEKLR